MTNADIDRMWENVVRPLYIKNPRHREYNLSPDAKRQMVALYRACRDLDGDNAASTFEWAIEKLADAGVNVLQPPPPDELRAPEPERDVFGNAMPNPWETKDLNGQRILTQRNPKLAALSKKLAENKWQAWADWQDEQAAVLKERATKYDSEMHKRNVYANGANETEVGNFTKSSPDLVPLFQRESRPVTFPIGKTRHLTTEGQIARTPKLAALVDGMKLHDEAFVADARAAARVKVEQAQQELKAVS